MRIQSNGKCLFYLISFPIAFEEGQLDEANEKSLFDHISNFRVGKALLFSPSSIVDVAVDEEGGYELRWLGSEYLAIRVRQRITKDGGKSLLAV